MREKKENNSPLRSSITSYRSILNGQNKQKRGLTGNHIYTAQITTTGQEGINNPS